MTQPPSSLWFAIGGVIKHGDHCHRAMRTEIGVFCLVATSSPPKRYYCYLATKRARSWIVVALSLFYKSKRDCCMRMRCRRCDFRVAVTRRVVNYGLCRGGPEARVAMCRYRLQQQHLGKHYALHLRARYSCDVALPIVTSSARLFYHYFFLLFFFIFINFFL